SGRIAKMGPFELITEGRDLPGFAFKIADPQSSFTVFDLTERLRTRGWLGPAYTFPEDPTDTPGIPGAGRNRVGHELAGLFLGGPPPPGARRGGAPGRPPAAGARRHAPGLCPLITGRTGGSSPGPALRA